jgi:hypothetical protein
MRGVAHKQPEDEPEPLRDLRPEVTALIAGAAALQAEGRCLTDRMAYEGAGPDAVVELSNLVRRYGEHSAALRDIAAALGEHDFIARHFYGAGAEDERAAAVPRQRRTSRAGVQEPLPLFLVEGLPAVAE